MELTICISVQNTWEEQEEYLITEKLGKYDNHFIARYEDGKVVEVWKISGEDILAILLPKLKRDYDRKNGGNHKDPRLSATINKKEIYAVGERVL